MMALEALEGGTAKLHGEPVMNIPGRFGRDPPFWCKQFGAVVAALAVLAPTPLSTLSVLLCRHCTYHGLAWVLGFTT